MITIDFLKIARWSLRLLTFVFHLTRIMLIFSLGTLMSFFAILQWDVWGLLVMMIILISIADWFIGIYFGRWVK